MSSIKNLNVKKYTIALFQGGLGDHGEGFDQTMTILKNKSSSIIKINEAIQMNNFDVEKQQFYNYDKDGYLKKSTSSLTNFANTIASIAEKAKENENKVVLVKTSLDQNIVGFDSIKKSNKYLGFDSIENQSKKLIYIINAFKNLDANIRIILVGHSQGGLVNLETACTIPNQIYRLISIATPYSAVGLAQDLCFIAALVNIVNVNLYEIMNTEEDAKRYEDRVNILADNNYYNDLKNRWNNLSNRPGLVVIAGVSGKLRFVSGAGSPGKVISYRPFDGLVAIDEQLNIENCMKYTLTNKDIACYDKGDYKKHVCTMKSIFDFGCNGPCSLSMFILFDALVNVGLSAIWKYVTKDPSLKEIDSYPIIKEIFNGVSRSGNEDPSLKNYYDVYANDYSHMYIRYCEETISILYNWLTI